MSSAKKNSSKKTSLGKFYLLTKSKEYTLQEWYDYCAQLTHREYEAVIARGFVTIMSKSKGEIYSKRLQDFVDEDEMGTNALEYVLYTHNEVADALEHYVTADSWEETPYVYILDNLYSLNLHPNAKEPADVVQEIADYLYNRGLHKASEAVRTGEFRKNKRGTALGHLKRLSEIIQRHGIGAVVGSEDNKAIEAAVSYINSRNK